MNDQPDHFQTDLSVGEILRRTRQHYNQTLPDIERALRIRASQLEALENGNYALLPGRVYVIGFIRSYSEYLGLDGDKMVNLFKTQSGGKQVGPVTQVNSPVMASDTKMPHGWQVIVSVLALLVVLGLWWSMQKDDRTMVTDIPAVAAHQQQIDEPAPPAEEPPPVQQTQMQTEPPPAAIAPSMPPQPTPVQNAAPPETPAVAATTASAPQDPDPVSAEIAAAASGTTAAAPTEEAAPPPEQRTAAASSEPQKGVILNIKKNSWVEIRGKDGKSIVSRVLKAGDRYYVPDRPDLTISLGNAGGVEFEVEGKKLKPVGATGEVKRNVPLDMAYLKKNYGS